MGLAASVRWARPFARVHIARYWCSKDAIAGAASPLQLQEEAGITAVGLDWRGVLLFKMGANPQPWEVHGALVRHSQQTIAMATTVFSTAAFEGVPVETDEMAPVEFEEDAMPYDKMWQDDRVWQPLLFHGERFHGMFEFDDGTTMLQHHVRCLAPEEAPPVCLDTPIETLQQAQYWTRYI